jgi:hypothetical protein
MHSATVLREKRKKLARGSSRPGNNSATTSTSNKNTVRNRTEFAAPLAAISAEHHQKSQFRFVTGSSRGTSEK